MNIEYKITDYFEKNELFDNETSNGLTIKNESNTLLIKGSSRDLVELADIIVNLALVRNEKAHIHLDNITLINKESEIAEIVLEKE